MTPASRQFLAYIASQPKGRVGYEWNKRDEVWALSEECWELGYINERAQYPHRYGLQITDAGKAFLGGLSDA